MAGDWAQTGTEQDETAIAEAYAQEGGQIYDLEISYPVHGFARVSSTSDDHEVGSDGTGRATSFTHVVSASSAYGGVCVSSKPGRTAHAKSGAGARMVKHYESLKAGRAKGRLSLSSSQTGPNPDQYPQDTVTVVAGSSQISATFSRYSGNWSVYGVLYTATGVQQINQQVVGFGNLNLTFDFDQAVVANSSFTIASKTNNGQLGDAFHMSSGGAAVTTDCSMQGSAVLNTTIE